MPHPPSLPRDRPVPEDVRESGIWVFESLHGSAFSMPVSRHRFPELLYFRAGRGHLQLARPQGPERIACGAGDCVMVPPHVDHVIEDAPGSPLSLYGLAVDPEKIAVGAELGGLIPGGVLPRQQTVLLGIEQRMRRLLYLTAKPRAIAKLSAVALAIELVAAVAQVAEDHRGNTTSMAGIGGDEIDEYLRWLEGNFFEPVSLDDGAEACGYSRRKFTERFKRRTGRSWLNYLHALRVRHAVRLLSESDAPVTSIAFQCGFEDLSTFYRVFKRVAGRRPLEVRGAAE